MPPFGACRVCLVEVEKMPKLQTSCTLEATEGMVVNTQSRMADKGRKGILEFLLINHPLDCPICDRGGECPLQDQTLNLGPARAVFTKKSATLKSQTPGTRIDARPRTLHRLRPLHPFWRIVAGDHASNSSTAAIKPKWALPTADLPNPNSSATPS